MPLPAQNYTKPAYKITTEVLKNLREYAKDLMYKGQIAECLGIAHATFNRKLEENEKFREAYEEGRREGLALEAEQIREVKSSLFKNAKDHAALTKDGTEIEVPGDVKAQVFIMKSRAGWRDTDAVQQQVTIVIPPLFAPQHEEDVQRMFKGHDAILDV